MRIHPSVVHQNGIVSVTIRASFIGDSTDITDQQRIQAYGDPTVNLGGLFTDPADSTFNFTFPASELYTGVTTDMQNHTARFMKVQPQAQPTALSYTIYQPVPQFNPFGPGNLDCVISDPVRAATIWAAAIDTRIQALMVTLRAKSPAQLVTLPDATV